MMLDVMRYLLLVGMLAAPGCGGDPGPRALIDHDAWELVSPEQDPFYDSVSQPVDCPRGAYRVEGEAEEQVFEVDTGLCNYLGIVQPSLAEIRRGDVLEWSMWHLNLVSLEEARANVGLFVGGQVVWERTIPIPGPPAAYLIEIKAEFDAPRGTPVVIHIDNHGTNNWKIHRFGIK